jgi:hypothetical protein
MIEGTLQRKDLYRISHLHLFPLQIVIPVALIFAFSPVCSQTLEFGAFGGVSYYLGDLNPGKQFQQVQPAYGVLGRYNIDDRWTVKLSGYHGTVKGSSQSSTFLPGNELKFESPITDISAVAEFNFFEYFTGSHRNNITPYIYAGVGVFWFNPQADGQDLRALGTEGQTIGYDGRKPYSTMGISFPFGLGVKYSLSKKFCLTAFWELHKTFSDYIDDVSQTYYLDGHSINPDDIASVYSDPTRSHEPGMQRGNSHTKDWYSFAGVAVTYKFIIGSGKKCRDLRHKP